MTMLIDRIDSGTTPLHQDLEQKAMFAEQRLDPAAKSVAQKPESISLQTPAKDEETTLMEEIEEAVDKLNETVEAIHKDLRFKLHEESERWMVQVFDIKADELIKEMPPERVLDVLGKIANVIGVMIDQRG